MVAPPFQPIAASAVGASAAWLGTSGAIAGGVAALVAAWLLHVSLLARSDGDEDARAAAAAVRARRGSRLMASARAIAGIVVAALVVLLSVADSREGRLVAWGFLVGAALALAAAFVAQKVALAASPRVAAAASRSTDGVRAELALARRAARIVRLASIGLALLGALALRLVEDGPSSWLGLALGAATAALLARAAERARPALDGASEEDRAARAIGEASLGAAELLESALVALVAAALAGDSSLPLALLGAAALAGLAGGGAWRGPLLFGGLALLLPAFAGRGASGGWAGLAGATLAGFLATLAAGHAARRLRSIAIPTLLVAAALLLSNLGAGLQGVALAALGSVAARALLDGGELGTDGEPELAARRERATIGAALAAIALLWGVIPERDLPQALRLLDVDLLAGLLVGAATPALFAALPIVADTSGSTNAALRAMIPAGLLAVATPLVVGGLNRAALGGLLAGSIAGGFLLALLRPAPIEARRNEVAPAIDVLVKVMALAALVAARR
jgi:hypothetical protein